MILSGVFRTKKYVKKLVEDTTDKCLEFTYNHSGYVTGDVAKYEIALNGFDLGESVTDDNLVVVEMDFTISGEDVKAKGYNIFFDGTNSNGSTSPIARFRVLNTKLERYTNNSGGDVSTIKPSIVKEEFINFKFVLNKKERICSYYINNVEYESNIKFLSATASQPATNFTVVKFYIPKEDEKILDSKFYIDNLKIYEVDDISSSPASHVIDDNFDAYAIDTIITNLNNQQYSWDVLTTNFTQNAKIIAKSDIGEIYGFQPTSEWTLAKDVDCADGETVETKLANALYIVSFDPVTGTLITKSADYTE